MSEQKRLDEDQRLGAAEAEMERLLRQLAPRRPELDVANVLAEAVRRADAARRSATRQAWIWRGAAAGLAAALAVTVWMRHGTPPPPPQLVNRGVDAPAVPVHVVSADEGGPLPDFSYLILRQRVLTRGMAGLPDAPSPPEMTLPLPGEGHLR